MRVFKHLILSLSGLFFASAVFAQRTEWLSTTPDTSYSTASDYKNNVKKFPQIKIVTQQAFNNVTENRELVYCTMGNRQLKLDAFIPKAKKKTPAIMIIHGGGWRSGSRYQHIPLAQHLAAKGFACFTVEYRLSTEALYPASVYDLKAALQWIKRNAKKYNVDTANLAVLGFSAGGHLAALVGLTPNMEKFQKGECNDATSTAVKAVVDIDGTLSFVHPEAWETQNVDKINASAKWLGYPRTENIELWTEASPLTYAGQNRTPFLFLNSSVERMHAGRTDFKQIADKNGVYVEIKEFENSPHSFCLYEPWFTPTVNTITNFLNKVFKK